MPDSTIDQSVVNAFGTVTAGSTRVFEMTAPRDGQITGIDVSTFVGQETDLRYRFELDTESNTYNLLQNVGEDYIAGNGERYELPVRRDFSLDDTLRVRAENMDGTNDYTASARIMLGYNQDDLMQRLVAALRGEM